MDIDRYFKIVKYVNRRYTLNGVRKGSKYGKQGLRLYPSTYFERMAFYKYVMQACPIEKLQLIRD